MRLALALLLVATLARADAALPSGGASSELRPFRSGDPQGDSLVATAAAIAAIEQSLPDMPTKPIELPDEIVGLRFRGTLLLGTPDEIARAIRFLSGRGPRRFDHRRFRSIGDMGFRHAGPAALAAVDRDSRGRPMGDFHELPDGGLFVACFDCRAPEVLSAIAALGGPLPAK